MAGKNYKKEELKRLVEEFTTEFDSLVKTEAGKTGQALKKSEDGGDDKKEEKSSGGDSDKGPPSGGDSSGGGDASAGGPPPAADPGSASAGGPPSPGGDPASAGGVPPADPAAGAASGDPVQALTQAYSQLSPEELQSHFFALQQVLQAQMGAGAGAAAPTPGMGAPGAGGPPGGAPPGADPMAAAMAGPGAAGGAPAPVPGGAGPAPLAGEGSKPVDPMASAAMKSVRDELDLVKAERDAFKKSLTGMADTLEKLAGGKPQYKATQATDAAVLAKSEQPQIKTMTTAEVRRKLAVVAASDTLKKSDRNLINKYCVGSVQVDAIAHLLA